jgi:hypothetical protein
MSSSLVNAKLIIDRGYKMAADRIQVKGPEEYKASTYFRQQIYIKFITFSSQSV